MFIKLNFENSNNIGVFIKLTNSYCIVPYEINDKSLKTIEKELKKNIPIIKTSILQSKCLGRLIIGNKKGLILPSETTFEEYQKIKKFIPENVIVKKCPEKFSALGNCIVNNDFSALAIPEISNETEELLGDVLGVEVFKVSLGAEKLLGSFCVINNYGGLISQFVSLEDQDEISSLLKIPLTVGTVNCGDKYLSSGMISNDWIGFCGFRTMQSELLVMETTFSKKK
ncbi:eif6 (nucleomorph) [Hemiselmis andersenii]|uniref:Eukaryotic translation initiation factor 6 n=1 Tax=Hemiselmis andersenii TaxID=464988 RepID=A9BKL5_HEMAN|nr:eif6 [Hemiselmis andersenii]ABW98020.1 eif6 [Hemiselmis andersenii]|mmetsp:Transcript_21095/g.48797  ORF Transcript_21095/g.48797 Transcript_21095/m.48797 type:complete len:227 (-) Transcript_21095:146-826(-)